MGALADRPPVSWKQGWTITAVFALAYGAVLVSASLLSPSGLEAQGPMTTPVLPPLKQIIRDASAWLASWAPLSDMSKTERLALLLEENEWKNSLVMWMFPEPARQAMPHFVQTWVRCIVLCAAVYFIVGLVWCYYAYYCFGDQLFKPGTIPALGDVFEQIKVSCSSIPLYSLLPAITEYMAEKGWTMAYPRVDNVGIPMYAVYFVLYMTSVEFGVYWMHRGLHEVKIGYKLLHAIHHKYNKEHTLSPFAGLAFHPLDGVMQAIPYTWTMFFCPMHFLTHEMLLFATGVWTANIHDCIHGKVWPIMGAGYHTIHHTTYKHNYGHYFTFMDQLFGTLYTPEEEEEEKQVEQNAVASPAPAVRHADATAHIVSSTPYNTRSRKSAKADA